MAAKKKHHAVGVFETRERAEQVINELKAAGFDEDKIGLVHRDAEGNTVKEGAANETYAEEGAVAGAVAGAGAMALGSLAVSFGRKAFATPRQQTSRSRRTTLSGLP